MGPEVVSIDAYAEACKVSTRTVRRWLAAGLVPGAAQDRKGVWSIPAAAPAPVLRPNAARRVVIGEFMPDPVGDGYGTMPIPGTPAPPRPVAVVTPPRAPAPVPVVAPEVPRFTLPPHLWLTPAEVAAIDGRVSVDVIRGMCRDGEISGVKRGPSGGWLIPRGVVVTLAGLRP